MPRSAPLLALVVVTAIWGYTFVPVQEAVAVYPLFAFLAVRFAISTLTLAPFALGAAPRASARRLGGRARRRDAARRRLRAPDRGARADDGHEHRLHHRPLRRLHAAPRARRLPDAGAGGGLGRRRVCAGGSPAAERRARRVVARERARPRERRRAVAPDRRDGAVRAALRREGLDLPADARRFRGIRRHRTRARVRWSGRTTARPGTRSS